MIRSPTMNYFVVRRLSCNARCRQNHIRYVPQSFGARTFQTAAVSQTLMTSYVAHHTKKKQILARKEAALQRLVDSNAPVTKLVAAADEVRDARIRVLHVQRSIIVPKDDADVLYAKIDRKIQTIADTPTSAILAEFGCVIEPEADVDGSADGT